MTAKCDLCPFLCDIPVGGVGKCKVRGNVDGAVKLLTYGMVTTMELGPVEQKPLYHFHPGMKVLSIGGLGCNMFCKYCQNFEISQVGKGKSETVSPDEVVRTALERKAGGIAYTYSEPYVWYEYVMDVARAARAVGLKNVLKTNGFATPVPFAAMCDLMDGVNIDVKGNAQAYKEVCGIDLPDNPWDWDIIKNLSVAASRCHLEVSMIAIPAYVADPVRFDALLEAMVAHGGRGMPIHLLKFIPDFRMRNEKTTSMEELRRLQAQVGRFFRYVYVDFAGVANDTVCECGEVLTTRLGIDFKGGMDPEKARLSRGFARCPRCYSMHNFML